MMVSTTQVYITDKTGKKFFKTLCSTDYADSEIRNLTRKLSEAQKMPKLYSFLDLNTAKIQTELVG